MGMEEPFKFGKFFAGLFHPLNWAKAFVFGLQACAIAFVLWSTGVMCLAVKNKFLSKKAATPPVTISTTSGPVRNSADEKKMNIGVINL